jgi:hypothetical protein
LPAPLPKTARNRRRDKTFVGSELRKGRFKVMKFIHARYVDVREGWAASLASSVFFSVTQNKPL